MNRHQRLFDTYIARMFSRTTGMKQYDDDFTKQCLAWLAQNMQLHNQEVFLIEGLQPSWLPTRQWQHIYFLLSRLCSGLIFGLVTGLIYLSNHSEISWFVRLGFSWFVSGLLVGFIDSVRFQWIRKNRRVRASSNLFWSFSNVVVITLISGVVGWLILGFPYIINDWRFFGVAFGVIFGLRGSRQLLAIDTEPVEALRWSWRKAVIGGLIGLLIGVAYARVSIMLLQLTAEKVFFIMFGQHMESPFSVMNLLVIGLIYGLIFALLGAIFRGLHSKIIETKSVPNQGIRLSISNAVFGGSIIFLGCGLFIGLDSWLNGSLRTTRLDKLLESAIGYGLLGALWYGGLDVIQHYALRFILIVQRHTPRNYAHFLDYAVDRIFLQKVGGGYRFIHRLLLEHFADMYKKV